MGTGWRDAADPVFARTMDPYRAKNCIYLQGMSTTVEDGIITATGEFTIADSCYIDDTGHFNAVEFTICFNQLFYATVAEGIRSQLHPALNEWTLDEYWQRRLPDVLIHKSSSTYKRPINPRAFSGEVRFDEISTRMLQRGMLTIETSARFWDDSGGAATGNVRLALVNVPESARRIRVDG